MRAIALQYHDVIDGGAWEASGFPGDAAATYKLSAAEFAAHVRAVSAAAAPHPLGVLEALRAGAAVGRPVVLFTFDDGGVSAIARTADTLEAHGWRGHFFVTTDYVGTPGFLTGAQIRELHARGHIVGAHSCSHPVRMSQCTPAELRREWGGSVRALADVLGAPVAVASVPGGYYAPRVAEAAAQAGVRALFTSEPVSRVARVGECLVLGRYTLRRGTPAEVAASLAAGRPAPQLQQWVAWNTKKVAKRVAGRLYLRVRRALLK